MLWLGPDRRQSRSCSACSRAIDPLVGPVGANTWRFQTGSRAFTSSTSQAHASNASPRCAAATAQTRASSPIARGPKSMRDGQRLHALQFRSISSHSRQHALGHPDADSTKRADIPASIVVADRAGESDHGPDRRRTNEPAELDCRERPRGHLGQGHPGCAAGRRASAARGAPRRLRRLRRLRRCLHTSTVVGSEPPHSCGVPAVSRLPTAQVQNRRGAAAKGPAMRGRSEFRCVAACVSARGASGGGDVRWQVGSGSFRVVEGPDKDAAWPTSRGGHAPTLAPREHRTCRSPIAAHAGGRAGRTWLADACGTAASSTRAKGRFTALQRSRVATTRASRRLPVRRRTRSAVSDVSLDPLQPAARPSSKECQRGADEIEVLLARRPALRFPTSAPTRSSVCTHRLLSV